MMAKAEKGVHRPDTPVGAMTQPEMDQLITCAAMGRIGLMTQEGPYIVPVGYGYSEVKVSFDEYMSRGNRKLKEEVEMVRICLISPYRITGRKIIRTNSHFSLGEEAPNIPNTIHN